MLFRASVVCVGLIPELRRLFEHHEEALPPPERPWLDVAKEFASRIALGHTEKETRLSRSVVVIPGCLSEEECSMLRGEADLILGGQHAARYTRDLSDESEAGSPLRRVSFCDMQAAAQNLSQKLLLHRILPALQFHLPQITRDLDLDGFSDPSSPSVFEFASDEPTVNRYTKGGEFKPHEDGYSLTIIILLSEKGAFRGGGTEFYEAKQESSKAAVQEVVGRTVLMQPAQGTALIFDGDITHAGAAVAMGTRHLFVASFNVVPAVGGGR